MIKRLTGILFFFLFPFIAFSQYADLTFTRIQGLPDRNIRSIVQDYKGFIWIATANGLNRYDGYEFKIYTWDSADKNSLSHNFIHKVFEDSHHRLWICTAKGLNLYNRDKDCFISYFHIENDSLSLGNNLVNTIYEDRSGNLWVGHFDGFSHLIIEKSDEEIPHKIVFQNHLIDSTIRINNWIYSICEDRNGDMWFGSMRNGAYRYSISNNKIKHYNVSDKKEPGVMNWIKKIFLDRDSAIWFILHNNQGLSRYDEATDAFKNFLLTDSKGRKNTSLNTINDVVVDSSNTFFMATDFGFHTFNYKTGTHQAYEYSVENRNGIGHMQVRNILRDQNGALWLGLNGNGLNYSSPYITRFRMIDHARFPMLNMSVIMSMGSTRNGDIYYTELDNGGFIYNYKTDALKRFNNTSNFLWTNTITDYIFYQDKNAFYETTSAGGVKGPYPIKFIPGRRVVLDSKGNAWGVSKDGLFYFSRNIGNYKNVFQSPTVNFDDFDVFIDKKDSVWLSSKDGLFLFTGDSLQRHFKQFPCSELLLRRQPIIIFGL